MSLPNTTPLTYNGYVTQIATMAVVDTTTVSGVVQGVDAAFNAIIPQMLNYAELRIQRDLDMLPTQTSLSYVLPSGTNQIQLDADDLVTIQTIMVTVNNAPQPVLPTSKEYIQNVYSSTATSGPPQYFAMYGGDYATGGTNYNNILLGPYTDTQYNVTLTGTVRAPTLYQSATPSLAATGTTFISTYYPDLLIMASLIYISAYQRNFGRMSDDPAMAQSYEGQYQALVHNAIAEENRKKFAGSAWSSMSTPVAATPSR